MSGNTVLLHRVLRASPDRVYRAFLDADAMDKWLPPMVLPARSMKWMLVKGAVIACHSPTSPPAKAIPSASATCS